jgi:hypothetical protein
MPTISLKAHYDGQSIQLDEPFSLPINSRLLVTVLPASDAEQQWISLSSQSLAEAFGDNEPEYTEADIQP